MLQHITVSTARAWNSWSDRPGEMVFLPLGIRVTPLLYSSRQRQCIKLEPRSDTLRLGRHSIDGSIIEFEADLAGTTLAFATTKPNPFAFRTTWTAPKTAEWGLRFWVNIAISAKDGTEAHFDPTQNITLLKSGDRFTAIATAYPPVQVTGHESLDALCQDYAENGYFTRDSRATSAPVLALRFNLEMMRSGTYAAAVADSPPSPSPPRKPPYPPNNPPPTPPRQRPNPSPPSAISSAGIRFGMPPTTAPTPP